LKNSWGFAAASLLPLRVLQPVTQGATTPERAYYKPHNFQAQPNFICPASLVGGRLEVSSCSLYSPPTASRHNNNNSRISPTDMAAPRAFFAFVTNILSTEKEQTARRHGQSLMEAHHSRLRESQLTAGSDLCHKPPHSISHNDSDSLSTRNIP
jgi:hypothetical protein